MYCPWCGAENPEDVVYCQRCGRNIKTGERPAQPRRWIGVFAVLVGLAVVVGVVLLIFFLVGRGQPARIAFLSDDGDVVTILPDGAEIDILTRDGDEVDYELLRWSPDHRWLAAIRWDWAEGDLDLWLVGDDEEEPQLVGLERWISLQYDMNEWSLAWSPDSRSVAVIGPDNDMVWNLVIVDIHEGRAQVVFEEERDRIGSVSWLSGGRELAITLRDARDGSQQLYTLRADGSNLERVRLEEADDIVAVPVFAPRGDRVAYLTLDIGESTRWLYVSRTDGQEPQAVMRSEAQLLPLEWTPDGNRLLF